MVRTVWSSNSPASSVDAKSKRLSACADACPTLSPLSWPKACKLPSHKASSTSSRQWGRLWLLTVGSWARERKKQMPALTSQDISAETGMQLTHLSHAPSPLDSPNLSPIKQQGLLVMLALLIAAQINLQER